MGRLDGKVALVTGGTSGIGAGTVARLAKDGARVLFTGRNADAAREVCDATGAAFAVHDVSDASAWPALIDRIASDYGRLDLAFANAGSEKGDASVEDITIQGWNQVIAVNQTGVMLTVQNAIKVMRDNPGGPGGSIVINSSMNAHRAMGNYVAYSVSKAAVVALAKSAALHCAAAGHRIRVNAILPGVVETAMIRGVIDGSPDPQATRAAFEGMSPLGRMASVDEVAALVSYLASDETGFISGAEIVIDGATTAGMMGQ